MRKEGKKLNFKPYLRKHSVIAVNEIIE